MRLLVILLFLLLPYPSRATHEAFHAYAAFGINYTPSSFRVGSGDWEAGMLNGVYGFDKIFDFGSRYYSSFGFVYTGDPGFYSAMGLKFKLWFIPMRCELSAYMDTKASGFASGLIGFTYGF